MNQAIYFRTSMFDVSKERENPLNPILSGADSCLAYFRELFEGNENFREVKVG